MIKTLLLSYFSFFLTSLEFIAYSFVFSFSTYKVSEKFEWAFGIAQQGESNISNNKPELILPEYTRVDFGAYYKIAEGLSIQMNIENLTDELYFPHSHSTHQASVGEPFNARISIRKTF